MIINSVLITQPEKSKIFLILKLTFSILYNKSVYKVPILSCEMIFIILSGDDISKLHEILLNKVISNFLLIYLTSRFERKMGFLGFRLKLGLRLVSSAFIIF